MTSQRNKVIIDALPSGPWPRTARCGAALRSSGSACLRTCGRPSWPCGLGTCWGDSDSCPSYSGPSGACKCYLIKKRDHILFILVPTIDGGFLKTYGHSKNLFFNASGGGPQQGALPAWPWPVGPGGPR